MIGSSGLSGPKGDLGFKGRSHNTFRQINHANVPNLDKITCSQLNLFSG